MIITIDGPAGSGKSTAARQLAARLVIPFLDTGAMYRAAALAAIKAEVDFNDPAALAEIVARSDIRLESDPAAEEGRASSRPALEGRASSRPGQPATTKRGPPGQLRVFLDGREVTEEIRSPEISEKASLVARAAGVRDVLVARQRQIGAELGSLVTEGRDQGSVVFPGADVKFFLDASPSVRAQRRCEELNATGQAIPFEVVLDQIVARDRADRSREAGPLRVPAGALELDTSNMSIQQVVDWLVSRVAEVSNREKARLTRPPGGAQP